MMKNLEMNLMKALKQKEFVLYYQPKLNLSSGKIMGVEALIRWEHPEKGTIPPKDFIPFAEESGLIIPIGEWVLHTACQQNKAWQEDGLPPLIMAVNLSARQLFQANIVDRIQFILKETGLSPEYLEIEITESMVMDVQSTLPILKELKRIGVRISLDDFGTGYSSLYYLKEFPIDIIKIDQSFVRNCTMDMKDSTIVKAIIAMSHELKLEVIAEGIESKDQLIFLQQHLCNKGQGYFFSKPLPPNEFVIKFYEIEQIVRQEGLPQKVSNQKWLEVALEKTRQELRETMRQQQGMIFKFVEKDGKFIHTLSDGELLYRMGLTPERINGREVYDFLEITDAEEKLPYYQRAWEGEENVTYEGKLNDIWYFASLRAIRRGGQVAEVIGSCVDITDRKKVEEQYRRLVEFSPEPIIVYHRGFIQYANPACIQLLGASSLKELTGKSIMAYFHPESVRIIEKRIQELNEIGISVPPTEEKIIRVDGTLVDVEVTGITIEHDDKPSFLMIYHDITGRKRTEEALRKSESEYRLIAENMQDLIRVIDTNGVIQYASPSHESVLGFSPSVYKGSLYYGFMHPDDISRTQEQFSQMISTKTPRQVEFRYKHSNGGWVYVESFGTPVLNEQDEVTSIVIAGRDISERKKAEDLIRKSEKLSVVGQLAAGVAHEIRNPLTSIKGFVQLLQKELDKPFFTDVILSEIKRIERIVGEFLTLAKPQLPQMKEIDVIVLLEQVVFLFDSQAFLHKVGFIQEVDSVSELPPIYCDANQIKQVFINILQNAIEAMTHGGIIKILINREDSDSIKIRFIDQGCGIPEERIKKIGEPFYSTKEKGTGLGLMISQKIVQEHGGTMNIESTVNQGTKVDVILPALER
ncbi:EAL domain-containing protein [Peribacillus kribbensis]|uniref:EAL domain-containing protein n=1 Tax=Peribacillus kribbensis TaxID=356658 RepID=UPI00041FEACE|nr:EAL domain-containing protein [Peribacillus kribbensis]